MQRQEKLVIIWLAVAVIIAALATGGYFLFKEKITGWFSPPSQTTNEFNIYGPIDYEKYKKFGLGEEQVNILFEKMKGLDEAIKANAKDYEPLIQLGGFEKILKEYEAALKNYRQAITVNPDYGAAYAEAADLYIYPLGRYAEAEDYLKKAIERSPFRSDYYRWLADLYIAKFPDKKAEIEPLMLAGVKENPDNVTAFYSYLASYFQQEGDLKKAIAYVQKCVQAAPDADKAGFRKALQELQAELRNK